MWIYVLGLAMGALAFATVNYEGLAMLYTYHRIKEKSVVKTLKKTCSTVVWMAYLIAYQKIAKNIERLGRNEYDVHYMLGNRLYKIRVYSKNGPRSRQVLQVIDQSDNDVTAVVAPYLGPLEDWHGRVYRPSTLLYESLTFNMANGESMSFSHQEPMFLV